MHKIEQLNRILDAIHPNIDKVKTKWIEMKWKKNRLNILNGYDYHPNAQSSMLSAFAVFLYVKMIDPFWQWWEIVTITKFTDFCVHACVCVFLTINSSAVHNDTSYQFVPSQKSARIHFFIVNFVSFLLMCVPARTQACSNIRYN